MSYLPIWLRDPRSYIEDLAVGEWGEGEVRKLLLTNDNFLKQVIRLSIKYMGNPKIKKSPIYDGDIDVSITIPPFEVKTRSPNYMDRNDILIELYHTYNFTDKIVDGWYYQQPLSPVIIYVWRDSEQTKLLDGYIILIKDQKLTDLISKFKTDDSRIVPAGPTEKGGPNLLQKTFNLSIKINEFPIGTIEHISAFNTESKILTKAYEWFK